MLSKLSKRIASGASEKFVSNILRVAAALALAVAGQQILHSETPRPLEFEVASVRPTQDSPKSAGMQATGAGYVIITPEKATYRDITLKSLVMRAYGLKSFQVSGPGWIETERYDVLATIPEGASKADVSVMLQNLLTERFKIRSHTEKKKYYGYILGIGKQPLKLKPAAHKVTANDSDLPDKISFFLGGNSSEQQIFGATMVAFANLLSNAMERPVLDSTGIIGKFDFTLPISPSQMRQSMSPNESPEDPTGAPVSIFAAVHDIGLSLTPSTLDLSFMVVDKALKLPTEN